MSVAAPVVQNNTDGSLTIQYVPSTSGVHELNFTYNEKPVPGGPLRLNVDATDNGHLITAYGPGLSHGVCGERQQFHVVSGHSSNDAIDVKIVGPARTDILKKEFRNGILSIEYLPIFPGEYSVSLQYKGKHILGSPFTPTITGQGRKKSHLSIAETSDYELGINASVDPATLQGTVQFPDGTAEPCILKKLASGKLGIGSFETAKSGTYSVDVQHDGDPYSGSPFQVRISEAQVANAAKVKATGSIEKALANEWNEIRLGATEAGYGTLGVTVEGGHHSDMEYSALPSGREFSVKYRPHEPGYYLLNLRFGDNHLPGSPFVVNVGGKPSGRIRALTSRQVQAPEMCVAGQECTVFLALPGVSPLDMEATLTSPAGTTDLCEIRDLPENQFEIRFKPSDLGTNILSLKQKGIHISGSPFHFTVGKPSAGGTHRMEFGGPGIEGGSLGSKGIFNIYTHEAGAGLLSVAIDGPSKANLEILDKIGGFVTVCYTVDKPGLYTIGVKFNDEHVPRSPCKVNIDPECKEAKMVTIQALRDRGIEVDKPATFGVNLNGVRGTLTGRVFAPSGHEEEMFIEDMDKDLYSCRFIPKENGVYYVHIRFNNVHIPGSPFPMLVGKLGADPALVLVSGKGLERGVVGKPSKFLVATTCPGTGLLTVSIQGPSKVPMSCNELDEGYEFTYTPKAPGQYLIAIKYCHVGIPGSPFQAIVGGRGKASDMTETSNMYIEAVEKKPGRVKQFHGDATKVVVHGPGLKKGFMGRAANFNIDIKDAGQDLLTVAMVSNNGSPVRELSVKKQKAGTYVANYIADEKGDHVLTVRWGANDVPGSPFMVGIN